MSEGDSVNALVGVTLVGVTLFDAFVACDELLDKMLPEIVRNSKRRSNDDF